MKARRSGRKPSGQATITDVADLAQCSKMTVSRVINGRHHVSERTRDAVLKAIADLNFSPNTAARALAGAAQIRVGLLYANPSAGYLGELLTGALDEANGSDVHLVIEQCDGSTGVERLASRLSDAGVKGVILPAPFCDDAMLLQRLQELEFKVVLIGTEDTMGALPTIAIDNYQAAYDMTAHIIALGHERVGFIAGNPAQAASRSRLEGFRDAMHDAGLDIPDAMIQPGMFTYRSGFEAGARLLEGGNHPTAIFASNDDMAAGAVAAALRAHLDVPSDVSVCGFDDTPIASTIWPPLTTVRLPIRDMGRRALALLAEEIRTGTVDGPQHLTLDYQLIRRETDMQPRESVM